MGEPTEVLFYVQGFAMLLLGLALQSGMILLTEIYIRRDVFKCSLPNEMLDEEG